MKGELYQKLTEYSRSDFYPYHMPGHKRRLCGDTLLSVAELDITEIDGFDNLHDAEGILKRLQEKAAVIYGAKESFYLVNGSTSGILSAVSAAVPEGGKLLMVRGCHKAAYHAAYLRRLQTEYLWTGVHPEFGCCMPPTAVQVEEVLNKDKEIEAVLIVSPTYEGLVADVAGIAQVAHRRGIPLIVDEAHGAHLGFHPAWATNSTRLGADLVVQSLHKTLPSMTQTAILHVTGQLINRERLRRFLHIYQSSSPSYVFMAAMEEALLMVSEGADKLFGDFLQNWNEMLARLQTCRCIRVLQEKNCDIGKLVIADASGSLSGQQLYDMLLHRYHLQPEMAAGRFVLAMFTVGDTREGYERMTDALLSIDKECAEDAGAFREQASLSKDAGAFREQASLSKDAGAFREQASLSKDAGALHEKSNLSESEEVLCEPGTESAGELKRSTEETGGNQSEIGHPERVLSLGEAWDADTASIPLEEAAGHIAGEFINLYPPGIPIIVPGERMTEAVSRYLQHCILEGLHVQGVEEHDGRYHIKVVCEVSD